VIGEIAMQEFSKNMESSLMKLARNMDLNTSIVDLDKPVVNDVNKEKSRIYLITRNESLENTVHPITGVPFERKTIMNENGEMIEGVFPNFESIFDAKIPEELYGESDKKQFKYCNEQLYEAIENNPDLKKQFSEEQLEQIKEGLTDGTAPDGYVWHHDAECGKIQLVEYNTHAQTGHTGGRVVWGGGNDNR